MSWVKDYGWLLEDRKVKEMDSPMEPPEKNAFLLTPWNPPQTFNIQNSKITHLYCFKPQIEGNLSQQQLKVRQIITTLISCGDYMYNICRVLAIYRPFFSYQHFLTYPNTSISCSFLISSTIYNFTLLCTLLYLHLILNRP